MKIRSCILFLLIALFTTTNTWAARYSVQSPNENLIVSISIEDNSVSYQLRSKGRVLIDRSSISLDGQQLTYSNRVITRKSNKIWKQVYGQQSEFRDHYNENVWSVRHNRTGAKGQFIVRVYDRGMAFRFEFANNLKLKNQKFSFVNEYKLDNDSVLYYPDGEFEPIGPVKINEYRGVTRNYKIPMVVELDSSTFLCLTESDLFTAAKTSHAQVVKIQNTDRSSRLIGKSNYRIEKTSLTTAWRVIEVAESMGDFVVSDMTMNLAKPCALRDSSWIKPGFSLWELRLRGARYGKFLYELNDRSIKRLIDFNHANGLEYVMIDGGWYYVDDNQINPRISKLDVRKLIEYGRKKGVGVWLYYDEHYSKKENSNKRGNKSIGTRPVLTVDQALREISELGAVGVKFGFRGFDPNFIQKTVETAAKYRLLINFHDYPPPMSGIQRTYPNVITTEYCHAQADRRTTFGPTEFIKTAQINLIAGPIDQNNGFFTFKDLKKRYLGFQNGIVESTVVGECARVLITSWGGFQLLPDTPEEYRGKKDLFQFIRIMPRTWDESKCLNSVYGETITIARRSGTDWFIGSATNESARQITIDLNFLKEGKYEVIAYADSRKAHYIEMPETYEIKKLNVTNKDKVTISMAQGGGHCMWIKPTK
ncbi:glycoside hydrolase family 97 catalytic domain-containing protein [Planctomycetota bacterium]|nr:glycoside hydrolase family 97 catalytic domain-containing protein [Planctomycetota bacterium]